MNLSTFETLPFSLVVVHVDRQAKMKTDTLLYQAQAVCQSMHSPIGKVSGGGKWKGEKKKKRGGGGGAGQKLDEEEKDRMNEFGQSTVDTWLREGRVR